MILVLACALSVALTSPAFAADYYIVQNTRTDECKVVRKKPKRNTLVLVGDGTAYASKKRATEVMGTIDDCKPGMDGAALTPGYRWALRAALWRLTKEGQIAAEQRFMQSDPEQRLIGYYWVFRRKS